MKKFNKYCFLTLILLVSHFSYADIFYGEEKTPQPIQSNDNHTLVKNMEENLTCDIKKTDNTLNILDIFEQLKLVGIIQYNQEFKSLFINDSQKILDFKIGDFFEEQQIQINHIDLKSISYINWNKTKDCHSPYIITIKL